MLMLLTYCFTVSASDTSQSKIATDVWVNCLQFELERSVGDIAFEPSDNAVVDGIFSRCLDVEMIVRAESTEMFDREEFKRRALLEFVNFRMALYRTLLGTVGKLRAGN